VRRALIIAVIVASTACATRVSTADATTQLRQATENYAHLILAMDGAAIAALYTDDGESVVVGQPPLRGPEAIRKQLESFRDYHVLSENLTADTITIDGPDGHVVGKYRQRVRIPSGDVVEVHGGYAADWIRVRRDGWKIRRMVTTPEK
jgi:uncharacterized protein (TIGR02246 family)